MTNIIPDIEAEALNEWGQQCFRGFEEDLGSLSEWRTEVEEIRKHAAQQSKDKTYPWPGASNVKYPLILTAALQFNARAYPTIINDGNIVLPKVIGDDPEGVKAERGRRIARHMSWQLTEEMDEWDAGMDALLLALPVDGVAFKKIYYDDTLKRNMSEFIEALDLVVNINTTSLVTCPRISHVISYYPYEIEEKTDTGDFKEDDYGIDWEANTQEPEEFVEQHCWKDLGDGLAPYILTFHKKSGEVASVVDNADKDGAPIRYFVKYSCFPDPEGGFYSKGFGQLLKPISDATDSILNLLIDAGHLANTGGGFLAKGFRINSGAMRFIPGEWKKVDTSGMSMRESVLPLPVPDPSPVLFNLLGLLIDAGKDISSIQDVMTGGGGKNTPVTTILAQIEQGMKVYTSIFKRIYRSLREELVLLYKLNGEHLKEKQYFKVMDDLQAIARKDYESESADIAPAADPTMATDIQRAAKTQVLNQYASWPVANLPAIMKEGIESAGYSDAEQYISVPPPGPSPEQLEKMAELEHKEKELDLKKYEAAVKSVETLASAFEKMAKADELGPDNLVNLQEIILGLQQIIIGKDSYDERKEVQQMEGRERMALPGPQTPPGPTG